MSEARISVTRIDRPEKNRMRSHLEEIIRLYRAVSEQMEACQKETEAQEYLEYWQVLKNKNTELIQEISRYMVRKCNR